ncbi:MAG: zf-HC2 domain-containing protein [Planctomycetia bacterium]|nr:zf-HC2 domain-containing protein [Planctomycetia bacterium]
MTCQQLIEFLTEYIEGQLPLSQRAAFELHLALCGQCRAYLHNFRTTIEAAQNAFDDPTVATPASIPEELVQAILRARRSN